MNRSSNVKDRLTPESKFYSPSREAAKRGLQVWVDEPKAPDAEPVDHERTLTSMWRLLAAMVPTNYGKSKHKGSKRR